MGNSKKRGGKRLGAGRKPSAATALKRRIIADRVVEAEYAFALFVRAMRDTRGEIGVRLSCAREVMDRVMGRPRQAIEHSGLEGDPILIKTIEAVGDG